MSALSPSQLRSKWSEYEAETMFNAATVEVIFGGLLVDTDLEWLSQVFGRWFVTDYTSQSRNTWQADTSSRWTDVAVLRPDEIRTLEPGHALVIFSSPPR